MYATVGSLSEACQSNRNAQSRSPYPEAAAKMTQRVGGEPTVTGRSDAEAVGSEWGDCLLSGVLHAYEKWGFVSEHIADLACLHSNISIYCTMRFSFLPFCTWLFLSACIPDFYSWSAGSAIKQRRGIVDSLYIRTFISHDYCVYVWDLIHWDCVNSIICTEYHTLSYL